MSSDLKDLQEILAVKFNNPDLLDQALIHRSYLNENKNIGQSNERLEFLGDSVLSVLVSTELYKRFPHHPEGKLTSLRSLLVKAKTLAEMAIKLKLGKFLHMSHGEERSGGRDNPSLLADTLEAILGAIYLDSGLEAVKGVLESHLFPQITEVEKREELHDYKSNLQELIQERAKTSPLYKVLGEHGPDHDKTFSVGVYCSGDLLGVGEGKSKQTAEQEAAKKAIVSLTT